MSANSAKASRRDFVKLVAAATLVLNEPPVIHAQERKISPNDKIRLATIGIGIQGTNDTKTALKVSGVELVAVADVYDGRLARAKEVFGDHIFTTRDYREILTRRDVDALIITTPDHWHAQIAIDAMNAGKDVYVQKPMVQLVEDGYRVIETALRTKRIVQVGSQGVSSPIRKKARELYTSGAIGELIMVEAWWNRNSAIGAWQYSVAPDASLQTIDWDRFLGNAPKVPFDPVRLFRWRNYRDYGTGIAGDLFVHLFTDLHFVLNSDGPNRVLARGALRFWRDGRDAADVIAGLYDYPKTATHPAFNLSLRANLADRDDSAGLRFVGSEGVMTMWDDVAVVSKPRAKAPGYTIDTFPIAIQEAFLKDYRTRYPDEGSSDGLVGTKTFSAPKGYSDDLDHITNFFQAVRSRVPVVEDAVFGLRAAGPAILTNLCYYDNAIYGWNPETMKITNRVLI